MKIVWLNLKMLGKLASPNLGPLDLSFLAITLNKPIPLNVPIITKVIKNRLCHAKIHEYAPIKIILQSGPNLIEHQ